jgi:type II restriction enzyme
LNTNFGTSIFEPVAITLAKSKFKRAESQVVAGNRISLEAQKEIQKIIDDLTTAKVLPNKINEIETIRKVAQQGKLRTIKPTKVDILLENHSGELFLFDIKTAKPNAGGFKEFKRTLLEWTATILSSKPKLKVHTIIAIPYNPYYPEPYSRWTMRGMLDLENELKVAHEFWDFLGGAGSYEDLLLCFERVGIELRGEIDEFFHRYNKK